MSVLPFSLMRRDLYAFYLFTWFTPGQGESA